MFSRVAAATLSLVTLGQGCARQTLPAPVINRDWPITGSDPGNSRYSSLTQINRDNVGKLTVAWIYHTGDASSGRDGGTQIQATPIVVHAVLYSTSAAGKAFALRADDGRQLWKFDPFADRRAESGVNRGVVYWEHGNERRLFFTAGSRLYALDPASGLPVPGFADHGSIDLTKGLGRDGSGQFVVATSPGVIYKNILIQGTRVGEDDGSAPGYVRAFDVRTGALRWIFHTIPLPGEPGYDTWPPDAWKSVGGANNWAGMAVDSARGLVYIPTGSATPDFYGGNRIGANLYANTLLVLNAATGKRVWYFQSVHHDLGDRDLPAPPNLLTVMHDGRRVDAVAQITKTGFVFLFDRATGAPLFPIEERRVPASDMAGEQAWPTQPFPAKPAPFARQLLTENDLTDLSPEAHAAVLARFRTLRADGLFTPGSLAGTVIFPGFDGGGEWGGAAVDRETSVIYVNGSDVPWIAALVPRPNAARAATARDSTISPIGPRIDAGARSPYRLRGYERWKDPDGYPAAKPPWGTLNAIDLNTGEYLWKIPLGEFKELSARGIPATGTEQYGGPIVTAGGVLFIAATQDEKFRAFDKRTGALLWERALPAAGYATPSTYVTGGRQFVVIAAGGGKLGTKSGDSYVAFALPR